MSASLAELLFRAFIHLLIGTNLAVGGGIAMLHNEDPLVLLVCETAMFIGLIFVLSGWIGIVVLGHQYQRRPLPPP